MLNVVLTGYSHGSWAKAAPKFARILGESAADSLPALIAGLDDTSPALREMCRDAIRLMGPAAAMAVPVLKRRFFDGPSRERYSVAETLAELGPSGIEVLNEAAQCGDRYFRDDALSIIRFREHVQEKKEEMARHNPA
jgi:HEAT repeat protein